MGDKSVCQRGERKRERETNTITLALKQAMHNLLKVKPLAPGNL